MYVVKDPVKTVHKHDYDALRLHSKIVDGDIQTKWLIGKSCECGVPLPHPTHKPTIKRVIMDKCVTVDGQEVDHYHLRKTKMEQRGFTVTAGDSNRPTFSLYIE